MYNEKMKNDFLKESNYDDSTLRDIKFKFKKVSEIEKQFKTDVFKFDVNQMEDLLYAMDATSKESLQSSWCYIKKYYKWAYSKSACPLNKTFTTITPEHLDKYIDAIYAENQFITSREKMYEICNGSKDSEEIKNAIDKAFVILLYEGVMGEELIELINLKMNRNPKEESSYINLEEKYIYIINGENSRPIPNLDDRTIVILKEAIKQRIYHNKNGKKSNANAKTRRLIDSEYLMRPIKGKDKENTPISYFALQTRFGKIKKWLPNPTLNIVNINISGMFDKFLKLEQEGNFIRKEKIKILKMYGKNEDTLEQFNAKYIRFKEQTEKGKNKCLQIY